MIKLMQQWPLWKVKALARVAKTRGRAFFRDPRIMEQLRWALKVRDD